MSVCVVILSRHPCRLLPVLVPFPLGTRGGCHFGNAGFLIDFFYVAGPHSGGLRRGQQLDLHTDIPKRRVSLQLRVNCRHGPSKSCVAHWAARARQDVEGSIHFAGAWNLESNEHALQGTALCKGFASTASSLGCASIPSRPRPMHNMALRPEPLCCTLLVLAKRHQGQHPRFPGTEWQRRSGWQMSSHASATAGHGPAAYALDTIQGSTVALVDTDTIWMRDPFPCRKQHPTADM